MPLSHNCDVSSSHVTTLSYTVGAPLELSVRATSDRSNFSGLIADQLTVPTDDFVEVNTALPPSHHLERSALETSERP